MRRGTDRHSVGTPQRPTIQRYGADADSGVLDGNTHMGTHRRIWQTTVSLLPTSVRAVSDRQTQRPASSGVQTTVSATDVL